ncbi:MAG: MBL fold metallo-hydrolase [Bacteroidota bacterium]|nr:MBL fold metallo-hydrolase [Bacteroidota bacterium]
MKLLFLGTGTSTGVPQIGCPCNTCQSSDSKDKRLRASILITEGSTQLLIDCGPDLRQQLLTNNIDSVSAILLTHEHYDHVGGLDDVRPLGEMQLYAEKRVLSIIQRNMPYCFGDKKYPGVPAIHLHEIQEDAFFIEHIGIQPIRVMHAKLPILGFRVGKVAYLTDIKTIEERSIEKLQDLDVLVMNALRLNNHISHLSLNEAIEIALRIGARQTYFTHMSHDIGLHKAVNEALPESMQLAYDGLQINI